MISNNRRLSMKSLVLTLLLIVISRTAIYTGINSILNNNQVQAQQQEQIKINKVWETLAELKTPESVVYAPKQDTLFVSNIDGKPDQKDQKGFISKISLSNGSITELNWITGLDAPKGMAIYNNSKLYVSDITDLVEIEIANGKITNRYNAPGSKFLNDVAVDNQGNIYVSDTDTNSIYILDRNLINNNNNISASLQIWLQSPKLDAPNGLYFNDKNNKLIVAYDGADPKKMVGSIKVINLQNRTISNLGKEGTTSPIGILDGIELDTTTGKYYYVTDNPAGKVYIVNADGTGYGTLIDLGKQGSADLAFVLGQNMIIIPIMQDNKLVAYKLAE
jgi:sugar lactone lactonase YvrE